MFRAIGPILIVSGKEPTTTGAEMTETTMTETITVNGCETTIETTGNRLGAYTRIIVIKGGKQVLDNSWALSYRKFSPSAHAILDPIVRRMELAVQGRTEESEAKRLAELDAYDRSTEMINRAMSL